MFGGGVAQFYGLKHFLRALTSAPEIRQLLGTVYARKGVAIKNASQ